MKTVLSLLCFLACSSLATAQGFRQVYPSYPIPHVSALVHWNGDTVFASGPNSLFMRSTDAGLTWTDVFSNDTHYDFPRMGANASGIFLLPAYTHYWESEFADSTSTFLLHYNPVTGDTHRVYVPVLCRMEQPTYLPREISVTSDAVYMLQNTKAAESGNMALVRSLDNGGTWQRLGLPDSLILKANICFRDSRFGILTSALPDSMLVQAVYITTNAGATWERVYGFHHPRNPQYSAIQCADDSTIVILGNDELLHVTRDRGGHWSVSAVAPFMIDTFDFLPDGTGFVCGGDKQVARTTDYGATWVLIKPGVYYGHGAINSSALTLHSDVFLYSDEGGELFGTRDGGLTLDFAFPSNALAPTSFRFFSRNEGVVDSGVWSDRNVYGTSDGGSTWDLLSHVGFIGNGNLYPATMTEFWAVRNNQSLSDTIVYHTSNKGTVWDASYIGMPGDPLNVVFYTRGNFTCGADSLCVLLTTGVLRTTDKGKSWAVYSQVQSLFADRTSNDERTLYACFNKHIWLGTPNRILRSDDYGQTWIVVASLDSASPDAFTELKAVSDSLVYVMKEQRTSTGISMSYLRTTDAGNSWETYATDVKQITFRLFNTLFTDGTGYASVQSISGNEYFSEAQLSKTTDAWRTSTIVMIKNMPKHWDQFNTWFFIDKDYGWAYLDALYRTTTGGVDWVRLPPPPAPSALALEQMYPNPTSSIIGTTIAFTINGNQVLPVTVELYNILGLRMSTVYQGAFAPGRHAVRLPTTGLSPGVHIVRLTAGSSSQSLKLIIR